MNEASVRVAAEAEVGLGLATDRDQAVLLALERDALHLALRGPQDRGVVAAAQATVGDEHEERLAANLGPRLEQWAAHLGAGRGSEVLHDLGDLLAVGHGLPNPLLRAGRCGSRR